MARTKWPGVSETDNGRYLARYRDADGHRHSRTFGTGRAAAAWKADREADVRRGDHVDPHAGRIRLEQWAATWMAARGVEASTRAANRSRLDTHVLTAFGRLPLSSITRIKVQGWVRGLERTVVDEKTGRTMAPATVHACVHLLSGMLRDAVREGYIRVNPCGDLDLPVLPPGRERSFTAAELDAIVAALESPPHPAPAIAANLGRRDRLIALTLVDTGLRWEELVGLRLAYRRDGGMVGLDLMRRRIVVADVTVEVNGKLVDKLYPKGKARRTVPVTPRVVDAFADYLATRPGVGPGDRAVVGSRGETMRKTWRARRWVPALDRANVEYAPPHTLRHTYGSRLVDAGRPLTQVQKLLGHKSVTTTARYLHVAADDFDGVLAALEQKSAPVGVRRAR